MRRVVITGMGCATPLGHDVGSLWEGLAAGRGAIGPLRLEAEFPLGVQSFAHLAPWDPAAHFDPRRAQQLDPFAQIAILAAGQAVRQAGFDTDPPPRARIAVIVGTAAGGKTTDDENARRGWTAVAENRPASSHPMSIPKYIGNAAASQVGMEFGFKGPTFCLNSACASASHAIGMAAALIRSGAIDAAVAGGSDIASCYSVLRSWMGLRILSPDLCRPFSLGRRGLVLGDGAGIVILESAESAAARGATPLAELAGFGSSMEGGKRDPAGAMAAAMRGALADAKLAPQEIDHVDAHGTGTGPGDLIEAEALRSVFADEARRPPLTSIKAMIGHTMGASGALGLIATVEAMRHETAPPTINHQGDDPACGFDVTPNQARPRAIGAALCNSFAFGGLNAALVLKRAS